MPTPAVLIQLSDGAILKRANLPGEPTAPIPGLDPALKWLIIHEPFAAPDYDERYYMLLRTEQITTTPHPTYPLYDQFRVTHSTAKRAVSEILVHLANVEQEALQQVFDPSTQIKQLTLVVSALLREVKGLTLTLEEKGVQDKLTATANILWQNDAVAKAKRVAVEANTEPDLDADFVRLPPAP